jgi:acetyltransferase-like isoleucine patch superfamily enzyme
MKLASFKYLFLSGIFLPFKVYKRAGIVVRKGAIIELGGRLTLGTSDKERPIVSRLPINLFFGKRSKIKIGHSVSAGAGVNIIVKDNAALTIGNNTYFTSDMHLEVVHSVSIGNDCAISWGVTIIDDDHHRIKGASSQQGNVVIGNKVWIGCNATILKNSTIGNNCVIGANSLVKGTFPDNSLIAGNPARIIKKDVVWE